MYHKLRMLALAGGLALAGPLAAQELGNSPYSRLGVGDISGNRGSIRNMAMGGTGASHANSTYLNDMNPAMLYYNNLVTFEVGVDGQLKRIANQERSQVDGDVSLAYLALAVPLSKRWSAAVGLRPYSRVNYQTTAESPIAGSPNPDERVRYRFEGKGGLSEAYFAHGVKLVKGLTAGVSASYIFGSITTEAGSQTVGTGEAQLDREELVVNTRTSYSDFLFKAGLAYRGKLNEKLNIGAGLVYSLETDIDTDRRVVQDRRIVNGQIFNRITSADSLEGTVTLPQAWQAGVSVDNGRNFTLAMDFATQQWSKFTSTYEGEQQLADSYRLSLGSEYTPNPAAINNYLQNITYRAGLSYGRTLANPNGNNVNDAALSLGLSLPLKFDAARPQDRSFINLAITGGQRGTTDSNLIRENYLRFNVGLTVNSKWFQRRRIE